jgi:hypothetical protein
VNTFDPRSGRRSPDYGGLRLFADAAPGQLVSCRRRAVAGRNHVVRDQGMPAGAEAGRGDDSDRMGTEHADAALGDPAKAEGMHGPDRSAPPSTYPLSHDTGATPSTIRQPGSHRRIREETLDVAGVMRRGFAGGAKANDPLEEL